MSSSLRGLRVVADRLLPACAALFEKEPAQVAVGEDADEFAVFIDDEDRARSSPAWCAGCGGFCGRERVFDGVAGTEQRQVRASAESHRLRDGHELSA